MGRGFTIIYPADSTFPAERTYEQFFEIDTPSEATAYDRPGWLDRVIVTWGYGSYLGGVRNILTLAGYREVLRPVTEPDQRYYAEDCGWIVADHARVARYPTLLQLWPGAKNDMLWDAPTCAALARELRALAAAQPPPPPDSDDEAVPEVEDAITQLRRIPYAAPLIIMCEEAAERGGYVDSG